MQPSPPTQLTSSATSTPRYTYNLGLTAPKPTPGLVYEECRVLKELWTETLKPYFDRMVDKETNIDVATKYQCALAMEYIRQHLLSLITTILQGGTILVDDVQTALAPMIQAFLAYLPRLNLTVCKHVFIKFIGQLVTGDALNVLNDLITDYFAFIIAYHDFPHPNKPFKPQNLVDAIRACVFIMTDNPLDEYYKSCGIANIVPQSLFKLNMREKLINVAFFMLGTQTPPTQFNYCLTRTFIEKAILNMIHQKYNLVANCHAIYEYIYYSLHNVS